MDQSKIRYLIDMSTQYLNTLEFNTHEKQAVLDASQDLFYQTLFDGSGDSELNNRVQMFTVMTHHLGENRPICPLKTEDLKKMTELMKNAIQ